MHRRVSVAICAIALAVACGGNPVTPSTPHPAYVTAMRITGPSTIAPGTSVQFAAIATLSDQSTQDYTTKVTWNAYSTTVLTISNTGLATGHSNGEGNVQATMTGVVANATVLVMPPGTYRLTGTVTESGLSVWGARVTVVAGTGIGVGDNTDENGMYRLFGVAGDVQVQVTDQGYVPLTKSTHVTTNSVLDFPEFVQVNAQPAFTGTFQVTIQAGEVCVTIPPADRTRTYTAVVTQNGPGLHVSLSGATFFLHNGYGNYFTGRFQPAYLTFAFGSPYYYELEGPDVVEVVAPDRVLAIDGFVETTQTSGEIHAALHGTLSEWQLVNGQLGASLASCRSESHGFILTPATTAARRGRRR
jgi:hypothetical protein